MNTFPLGETAKGEILSLSTDDRRRHLYIVGKSGTGKSTLLFNLMAADLENGRGFALLDPHGDLAKAIADSVPTRRTNDILYVNPSDLSHSVGFNPLAYIEPDYRPLAADHIVASFRNIWRDSWGPRMEYILLKSVRLLLDTPRSTLLGLPRLLLDTRYRRALLKNSRDPMVRTFWEDEYDRCTDAFRREAIAPIQNKIGGCSPYQASGAKDAALIAAELGIDNPRALTDLSNYAAWVKLIQHGVPTSPMHISTFPQEPTTTN